MSGGPEEGASKHSWGPPSEEVSFGRGLQTTIRASDQRPPCASSSFVELFLGPSWIKNFVDLFLSLSYGASLPLELSG